MTRDGALLGTPAYMSPEQARGELDKVGPSSDQYSLGVVLYRLLSGSTHFIGPTHVVIANVAMAQAPSLAECGSPMPKDLVAICDTMRRAAHSERYADCEQVCADLKNWLNGRPVSATVSSEQHADPLLGRLARHSWRSILLGSVTSLMLILGASLLFSGRKTAVTDSPSTGAVLPDASVNNSVDTPITPASSSQSILASEPLQPANNGAPTELLSAQTLVPPQVDESQSDTGLNPMLAADAGLEPSVAGSSGVPPSEPMILEAPVQAMTVRDLASWILDHGGTVTLEDGQKVFETQQLPEELARLLEVDIKGLQELPSAFQQPMPSMGIERLDESSSDPNVLAAIFNANLETLRRASLGGAHSDTDLSLLDSSEHIEEFELNSVSGLTPDGWQQLGKYPKLKNLSFYVTSLQSLEFLNHVPGLERLVLYQSDIVDSMLEDVANLTRLRHLDLGFNNQLTIEGLKHLVNLQNLTWLSLYKTPTTDAGLVAVSQLKGLTHLALGGTEITDKGLARLVRLKNLRSLDLNSTKLTDAAPKFLKNSTVEFLNVHITKLSDQFLKEINNSLPRLKKIKIPKNGISSASVEWLRNMHPDLTVYYSQDVNIAPIEDFYRPIVDREINLLDHSHQLKAWRLETSISSEIKFSSGTIEFHVYEAGSRNDVAKALLSGLPLKEWNEYELEFSIMSPEELTVTVGFVADTGGWRQIGLHKDIQTSDTFQRVRIRFTAFSVLENRNQFRIAMGQSVGTVYFKDMSLRQVAN
jgi:serine/threonine protein kinase